ncbi:MAG: DUF5666 domain-containing protein [Gammaproteobacteria bacterium]|jgi:hypothetical protein|nr:DUF5666 domain-containing protein [Gammaproteobacteria bacterium]MDH3751228.1 DUF5666 domain-containing protein [Gammaproteobacteria bacterium]MDH3805816.1 DUF5666 domain-containing protein [Gammaproteobacteria bacterium]
MKTNFFQLRYLVLVYLALAYLVLLTACSGGDVNVSVDPTVIPRFPPAQTSETITAHGAITGLDGVTINDVRYSTNTAIVTANGQPGTLANLRRGQIVTVRGRINSFGLTGTADSILFDANLIGPVESLDASSDRLTVMGQTVQCDSDTQFAAGIDPATFDGLAVGNIIQVSGYADAAGAIRATRIDPDLANAELQIIGKVAGHNLANLLFSINGLTVDYSSAIFIDLPGGAPSNGMKVKAIGTMSGGRFTVERLVTAPALAGNMGQRVQVAGVITRFNSSADFDINGSAAAVDTGTAFRNGDAADLALNAEVIIDGDFASGGRMMANRVTFGRLTGNTAKLEYDLSDFTRISVPTVFNVTVTRGPDFSIEVTIDEEVANRVDVTQTGSTLNIALSSGDGNIGTLEAFVTMPVLDRIDLTGVVNATLNDFNQSQITVNVGGVSRLRGNALTIDNLTASVSGVSLLDFGDIRPIGNANIDVSGVSQATLNMDVGSTMTGSVGTGQGTGASTLFYYGSNVDVNVTTDFLSSIVRLGETRP